MNTAPSVPELVLSNGRLHTLDTTNPVASAAAISGGKFIAVGITPSAIIRPWITDFRSPHPSLPYPITLFNADSASAACSATTIGPQPDEW